MSDREFLETFGAWLRSIEVQALEPSQLEALYLTGAALLDSIAGTARRRWVRLLLGTASGLLREEARDIGEA